MPAEDFLIRQFAKARDAGDMATAMVAWKDLCVRSVDLATSEIRRFTFPKTKIRLKEQDRGEALTRSLVRMMKMGESFRGRTGAEFRAAVITAVHRGCMDVGREEMAHEKHSGGSFDDRYEDSDGSRFDKLVEDHLRERDVLADEAEEAEHARDDAVELVHSAIPKIANDNYRAVLELSLIKKLPDSQIADELGITLPNVYQRRKRGVNELEKILRDYRP